MTFFDPASQARIKSLETRLDAQVNITLLTTGHLEDQAFESAAHGLMAATDRLTVEIRTADTGLPGFQLNDHLTFSAFPIEKELDPFLETIVLAATGRPQPPAGQKTALDQIRVPVRLTLYIALQCPFCPDMVRTVASLACYSQQIRLHIIDGSLFPEAARQDGVASAPCLILEDGFRWTGQVRADEILQMILHQDPSQLSAETLKTILEQGDAAWITREMAASRKIFDGLVRLLLHETWSVRLGAMVVVEGLTDSAPELASQICPPLMQGFDDADVPVKGDILYALGLAGNRETLTWIRDHLGFLDHPDLVETAEDAMESLREKLETADE